MRSPWRYHVSRSDGSRIGSAPSISRAKPTGRSAGALAAFQSAVRRALTAYGYEVCDGDATFYAYVKSPIDDDFRFAERLASQGVLVVPSALFYDPGYVRLSLTARPQAIAAAMPVFAAALNELGRETYA